MQRSLQCRATSALLAGLVTFLPALQASAARRGKGRIVLVVAPYAPLANVSAALAGKASKLVSGELHGRDEIALAELPQAAEPPEARPNADLEALHEKARFALEEARGLEGAGRHDKAAEALGKAVAALQTRPAAVDAAGGALLAELLLRLAVERMAAGDDDGGDAALAALVRLTPDRAPPLGNFPPAFIREFGVVQRRTLAQGRGSIRVGAAPGEGEARVFLDGRVLHAAPVLIKDVLAGEHFVRVERGGEVHAERVTVLPGADVSISPQLAAKLAGPSGRLQLALQTGALDRAALDQAAQLAKLAGAQGVVFGAVVREGDGYSVRSFAYLLKSGKLVQLARMALDAEMLGASLEVLRLGDDLVGKLASPPAEPTLPLALGSQQVGAGPASMPEVSASPPAASAAQEAEPVRKPVAPIPDLPTVPDATADKAPAEPPSTPVAAADPAARSVVKPGEPAKPASPARPPEVTESSQTPLVAAPPRKPVEAGPSRELVIPRSPTGLADDPTAGNSVERPRAAEPTTRRIEAVEPGAVAMIREQPQAAPKNHTVLWIVAGGLLAGALGAGGYLLWQNSRTASTATINATWTH